MLQTQQRMRSRHPIRFRQLYLHFTKKRASQKQSSLWHKKIKVTLLLCDSTETLPRSSFFLRSKKSFFWISATKGISLSEAGENFAVIVHVCVRETETQFGLVKLLPGRVPLSSLFTRFFGRTFNIKEDVAQQQHRLWVVRTTRLLVHLRDISSALCSVHAVWSQTTWLHLDKKCTVSI